MNSTKNFLFLVSTNRFEVYHLEGLDRYQSWAVDLTNKPELQKREFITDFLVKEGITLLDYSNSLVLWSNDQMVLVPAQLYDNSNTENLLSLNFGNHFSKNDADFNRIPSLNLVAIYTIPLWLKTLFVLKFPGTTITHSSTAWIKYLSNKNSTTKICGVLSLENQMLSFIVFQNDSPIICIQSQFQELDDIAYYIIYALQNSKLEMTNGTIEIFDFNSENEVIAQGLLNRLKDLHIFSDLNWVLKNDLALTSFELCV
jgi:hypothetical protein